MAKQCKECGRKGLFLKLNSDCHCEGCAMRLAIQEKNRQKRTEAERIKAERLAKEEQERLQKEERDARLRRQAEYRVKQQELFLDIINNLPLAHIKLASEKIKMKAATDLSEALKFTNITTRSNIQKLSSFVVIDIETTGIQVAGNDIIEVSALKFSGFDPISRFTSLLKPKKEISQEITELTGITNDMVADAPAFYQIVPSLLKYISGETLVGHNLEFDLRFLYRNGLDVLCESRRYYDTMKIAQSILKKPVKKWDDECQSYEIPFDAEYDVENHKLGTLCDYYSIHAASAHRAIADCLATGMLFKKLIEEKLVC